MWGPWRAEPPSETVLIFCKLCWSGNICMLSVSAAAGSMGVSSNTMQQLVHLVLVHGTWLTVRLREECWLLKNVKYSRLKTFKVTEWVCVCVCIWVCVCVQYNLIHATVFPETENLLQPAVLSQTQTVQCRLLYYLQHKQSHSLSYSYCSHQWHTVSCSCVAVALYSILL